LNSADDHYRRYAAVAVRNRQGPINTVSRNSN
jgi:hypothetical protein